MRQLRASLAIYNQLVAAGSLKRISLRGHTTMFASGFAAPLPPRLASSTLGHGRLGSMELMHLASATIPPASATAHTSRCSGSRTCVAGDAGVSSPSGCVADHRRFSHSHAGCSGPHPSATARCSCRSRCCCWPQVAAGSRGLHCACCALATAGETQLAASHVRRVRGFGTRISHALCMRVHVHALCLAACARLAMPCLPVMA